MQLLRQEGGLDELAQWMPELARRFEQMLMEYHDIFSLNKNEISWTDLAEHIIELLDEEPFKEKFWQITPPLLDEVWEHLQEMLDGGAICLLQSPWCNAVVLVRKKDVGALVLYQLLETQCSDQEGLLPPSAHAENNGIDGRSPVLFDYGFEIQVLASEDGREVQTVYCLHCWKHGNL